LGGCCIYFKFEGGCFASALNNSPVLKTTNRKAVRLIVRVAVDSRVARVQVAFPSISPRHGRRPKVRVRARIVESAISIAVAGKDLKL